MFHLFGKLYVEAEFRNKVEVAQINISKNSGYQHVDHPLIRVRGYQAGYATSLDVMSPKEFGESIDRAVTFGQKTFIYADDETYTRLFAAMVKALFPGIDYEHFKYFFICAKATYDTSTVNLHDSRTDHTRNVTINREVVERLYAFDEPMVPVLRKLYEESPEEVSLEWRIMRLRAFGVTGSIPETLLNLQRRTALNNTHDAMDDWGRVIMDETRWHLSGVNLDALLDMPSTFEACQNLGYLTDPMLRMPNVLQYEMPDEWIIDLVKSIIKVLNDCGDLPAARRNLNLLTCIESTDDLTDPVHCMNRLRFIFDNGKDGFRLGHMDSIKYNENLIRYALRADEEELKNLMEESTW